MTVNEFVEQEKAMLDRFLSFWELGHRVDPELYPIEMPLDDEGGWDEQFRAFEEGRREPKVGDDDC